MSESGERLKQARLAAGFDSARSAALHHRWTESTYASHENGQATEVPKRAAVKYAKAFKVSAGWILTGEGHGIGLDGMVAGLPPNVQAGAKMVLEAYLKSLGR